MGPFQVTENKGQHENKAHEILSIPEFSRLRWDMRHVILKDKCAPEANGLNLTQLLLRRTP